MTILQYAKDTKAVGTGDLDSAGAMVNRDNFMLKLNNIHIWKGFFVKLQSVTKTRIQQPATLSYSTPSKYTNKDRDL